MTKRMAPVLFIITFLLTSGLSAQGSPAAVQGLLDLRTHDFIHTPVVPLVGEWEFFWNTLSPTPEGAPVYVTLPDTWAHYRELGLDVESLGTAVYRLTILVPPLAPGAALKMPAAGSAYKMWVNGTLMAEGGRIGTTAEEEIPQFDPKIIHFDAGVEKFVITIAVSNHFHVDGGLWHNLHFGKADPLTAVTNAANLRDLFLLGSLLIMGFYHLGLFGFLRRDLSPLFFGLICLLLSLRIPVYGDYLILKAFPFISFEAHQKLGFLTFYLAPPLFYHFLKGLFPKELPKLPVIIVDLFTIPFVISVVFFPYLVYGSFLQIFQGFALVGSLGILIVLVLALIRRRLGAGLFLLGFFALFVTIVNDILYANLLINTGHWFSFGLLAFVFAQAMVLTRKFAMAFLEVDNLSQNLLEANTSFKRFVPIEFLERLKKNSVTEIQLGDHTEAQMAVLFSDIRSFTELSERMTPEENFRFINSFLERMGPRIRESGGFVDKYLGDGIMALFPGGAADAVKAALSMQRALCDYNLGRLKAGYQPVKLGIGLHMGRLMLGTIGERERMDSTVISDAVNLTSRLEGLTKFYKVDIITTLEVLSALPEDFPAAHRAMGSVRIKGKALPFPVFEIYEADCDEQKALKDQTREQFHQAMELLHEKRIPEAVHLLKQIQEINPKDEPVSALLQRLQRPGTSATEIKADLYVP